MDEDIAHDGGRHRRTCRLRAGAFRNGPGSVASIASGNVGITLAGWPSSKILTPVLALASTIGVNVWCAVKLVMVILNVGPPAPNVGAETPTTASASSILCSFSVISMFSHLL